MSIQVPIRIPLVGTYGCTGRFDGDTGSRIGRRAKVSKTNAARAERKRQRREWKKIAEVGY